MEKRKWEDINSFMIAATMWLKEKPENRDTKLGYAVSRVIKSLLRPVKKRTQLIEDINIDLALEENNRLVKDAHDNYVYSKANEKERYRRIREIDNSEFEVEPYYATSIPDDLSEDIKLPFIGFVIEAKDDSAGNANSNGGKASKNK